MLGSWQWNVKGALKLGAGAELAKACQSLVSVKAWNEVGSQGETVGSVGFLPDGWCPVGALWLPGADFFLSFFFLLLGEWVNCFGPVCEGLVDFVR